LDLPERSQVEVVPKFFPLGSRENACAAGEGTAPHFFRSATGDVGYRSMESIPEFLERRWNMSQSIGAVSLTAALLLLTGSAFADKGQAPDPRDARTPVDFVRLYAEAEKAQAQITDVEKLVTEMVPWLAASSKDAATDFLGFLKAYKTWYVALDTKLGKDPNDEKNPFTALEARPEVKAVEIKETVDLSKTGGPEMVRLTVWRISASKPTDQIVEQHLLLVKEAGVWKLLLPVGFLGGHNVIDEERKLPSGKVITVHVRKGDDQPPGMAQLSGDHTMTARLTDMLAEQTKAIADGKFKDRNAAQEAMLKALQAASQEK
jgi:hypothetical protein